MAPSFWTCRCPLSFLVVLILAAQETGRLHVQAYPSGAGGEACPTESPQVCHHGTPQVPPSPYSVVVKDTTYSPGVTVKVTIEMTSGSTPFKGFLLGAHRVEGNTTEYLGSFGTTKDSHPECGAKGNTGVTHSNPDPKTKIELEWTPPSASQGNIVFTASVLQDFSTYWVNVSSSVLKPQGFHPHSHSTTTPAPAGAKFPKDSDCGKTMSCYGECQDDMCTFLATWYKSNQSLIITVKSEMSGDNFWTALGFGTNADMDPASVTACVANKGEVQAFTTYNSNYDTKKVTPDPKVGLSNVSGSVVEGVFTCMVHRDLVVSGGGPEVYNLTIPYHILMARGLASEWHLQQHDENNAFVTDNSYDVGANVDIGAHEVSTRLLKLHGSFMTVAWILCASIGILVARFYKPVWGSQTLFGVKVWFAIHRLTMAFVFLATAAGFIIIFIHVGGYSEIEGRDYQKAHPVLGIIVTSLTVINPIMSMFRCDPNHELRCLFNWAHFLVGTSAYILGVVTVGIGLNLPVLDIPEYVTYCVIGFGAWHIFTHIMLEMARCCEGNDSSGGLYKDLQSLNYSLGGGKANLPVSDQFKGGKDQQDPKAAANEQTLLIVKKEVGQGQQLSSRKYQLFRQTVLTLHIFIALGVCVAVVYAIIKE